MADAKPKVSERRRFSPIWIVPAVALLLGLDAVPAPHDAADALAIAICHAHMGVFQGAATSSGIGTARSWRRFRPTQ